MNNNMKTIILFAMMASVVCLSCTHKRQQTQPKATPDKELAIMDALKAFRMLTEDTEYKEADAG